MGNTNSNKNNICRLRGTSSSNLFELCEGYAPKNEWFCAQCCKLHGCIAIFEDINGIEAVLMSNGLDNYQRRGLIRYMNIPDVVQQHTLSKPYKGEDRFMLCLSKEFQHQRHYPSTETIDEIVLRIVRLFLNDFNCSLMDD